MGDEKIMVVDDEPQILWLVSRFLRKLDYEVEEAKDGRAALQTLQITPIALVICDLKMPDIDGLEILEQIKELYPDTIFIMMTAYATIDLTISALRKGVFDFLTKPLDLKELALTVKQALQHRALSIQNKQLMNSLQEQNLVLERLHREEQRKAEQLKQINAISHQITAILDMDRLIDTVMGQASQAFPFSSMSFGIIENERVVFKGVSPDKPAEPVKQSILWQLTHGGKKIFVRSRSDQPTAQIEFDLAIPLQAGDQLVGFWAATWHKEATDDAERQAQLEEESLPYLEALAAQVAVVLENAHLYAFAKQADELAFLNQVGEASKQSLNLKESIQSVLIRIQSFGALLVEICLFDEQGEIQQSFSLVEGTFREGGEPILGREFVARASRSPAILHDQIEVTQICPTRERPAQLRSVLGVPLSFGTQSIGVLSLGSITPYTYTQEDARLLQIAGRQVAMAIENARLFQEIQLKQHAITESRNTLLAVFDAIPDGIYIVNRDHQILAINRTQASRVGLPFVELVGHPAERAFPQSSHMMTCIKEAFQSGKPVTCTERHKSNGRTLTEWNIHAYPVSGEKQELELVVVVVSDVTEQRQLEASLIQSEKMAAVGQLAAGIAHEINNPMTVISANMQILSEEIPSSNALHESVELIQRASERASNIVQSLLRFSRADQFDFVPTDVNLSIQDTVSLVRQQLHKADIELAVELAPDLPTIRASINHLRIVWLNLIMNARDAIQEAHRPGTIKVGSWQEKNSVVVQIADNGIGMSPDVLMRVYDPFFTTKAPNKGTGLGLFNCYRAVEQHHGEIRMDSEAGKGTTFEIRLPIQFQEQIAVADKVHPADAETRFGVHPAE